MIRGGAPFTRQAIADFRHQYPDTFARLEAKVPAGHHVTLICRGRPRPLGAVLVGPDGEVARVEPGYPTVAAACDAVLAKAREIVVEDREGYVVTAEVA